jgi:hypothetical protein
MNAKVIGLTGSIALHLLVAWLLFGGTKVPPNVMSGGHTEWKYNEVSETYKNLKGSDEVGTGLVCDKKYTGIGILHSARGSVLSVGYNTPAEKAGLLVGDIILNPEVFDGMYDGPKGTILNLRVLRGKDQLDIPIKMGTICYE